MQRFSQSLDVRRPGVAGGLPHQAALAAEAELAGHGTLGHNRSVVFGRVCRFRCSHMFSARGVLHILFSPPGAAD